MGSKNRVSQVGTLVTFVMKGFAVLIGLFAVFAAAGCGGSNSSTGTNVNGSMAATVSGTIAVGMAPDAIAVDSTGNKIYVADFGTQPTLGSQACAGTGADVMVIDGATESTTAVGFPFAMNPVAMGLNPASHTVYVVAREFGPGLSGKGCSQLLDGVEAIDTSTLSTTGIIYQVSAIGGSLSGIDVNQVNGNIYVGHIVPPLFAPSSGITVIDGNGIFATIPVGTTPLGLAVNATTNKIYVADSGSNNISVIDGATNSVTTITDPNAVAPVAVAVNSTSNTIYVANSQSNNLTVIDGATGSVTATVPVGTTPAGVAVDPQTNFIYVANAGNSQNGDPGNVTVINGATNTRTTLTDPKAVNPSAVAVNSVTNKIYVANSGSNNVTEIDGAH